MSAITTTAPSFDTPRTSGRRILVAGAVVAGLVVAGAVAIPRLTAQTASPSYPAVTPHDAVEHQLDTSRAAAIGAAERALSQRMQQRLDLGAKHVAAGAATTASSPLEFQPALQPGFTRAYVGGQLQTVAIPRLVEASVVAEQTGTIGHYAYTPQRMVRVYNGSELQWVPVTAGAVSSTMREQVGGEAPTYAWTPTRTVPVTGTRGYPAAALQSVRSQQVGGEHSGYQYTPSRTLHTRWTDPWVPPYDDPAWVPYIKSHYFHPVSARVAPTHEYR